MSTHQAMLTFSLGPVHAFIAQARKVADLWTGSDLLSDLMKQAIRAVHARHGDALFPYVPRPEKGEAEIPPGLPNRVVCRVPLDKVEEIARAMEGAVLAEWERMVRRTVCQLPEYLRPSAEIWTRDGSLGARQTDGVFQVSWSWVPESGSGPSAGSATADYAAACRAGAGRFAASRLFRPFAAADERDEKCAICGERTALPDGDRRHVAEGWARAEEEFEKDRHKGRLFRRIQSRSCLVCTAKRLDALTRHEDGPEGPYFCGFEHFQPDRETAYFALLNMDGDHMGDILGWDAEMVKNGDLAEFHRAVSQALIQFSCDLRDERPWILNLGPKEFDRQGKTPQLVYAGGEDVMVVCDPRDALAVAAAIRQRYLEALAPVADLLAEPHIFADTFTISAAILYAHAKHPAGHAFQLVEQLLSQKAKHQAGRNAVAFQLLKRGGAPVEIVFKWCPAGSTDRDWVATFRELVAALQRGALASRQSYNLRLEEDVLGDLFGADLGCWETWLRDRLRRGEASVSEADELARLTAPFLAENRSAALRIARFLGREMPWIHRQIEDLDTEEDAA